MDEEQTRISVKLINELITKHGSLRGLAKYLNEDKADMWRWKHGKSKVKPEAVIKMCKLFHVEPGLLRPDIFTNDVVLTFKKEEDNVRKKDI